MAALAGQTVVPTGPRQPPMEETQPAGQAPMQITPAVAVAGTVCENANGQVRTPTGAAHWLFCVRLHLLGHMMSLLRQRKNRVAVAAPPEIRCQPLVQRVVRRDVAWQTEADMRLKPEGHKTHVTPWVLVAGAMDRQGDVAVAGQVVMAGDGARHPIWEQVKPVGQVMHCALYAHTTPRVAVAARTRRHGPDGQIEVVAKLALHPPGTRLKPVGQETVEVGAALLAQVMPMVLVAEAKVRHPVGQIVVDTKLALHPPVTRDHPAGQFTSVLVRVRHTTPAVVVAGTSSVHRWLGQVVIAATGAWHPPVTRSQPRGQRMARTRVQITPDAAVAEAMVRHPSPSAVGQVVMSKGA